MPPLAQMLSIIRTGDSITLTLNRTPDNVQVIVQPVIAKTDDPDPQLAQLRALLATPFYFTVPNGGDVDGALENHLAATCDSRAALLSAEDTYLAAVNAAVENSRKAASAKTAKAAKASSGGKAANTAVAVEEAHDDDEASASEGTTEAATATAPPAAEAKVAPNLLADLDL